MNSKSHQIVTAKSIEILKEIDENSYNVILNFNGHCPEIQTISIASEPPGLPGRSNFGDLNNADKLTIESANVDGYLDLEVVNVDGGIDNPHNLFDGLPPDQAYHKYLDRFNLSAYNHYIDIKMRVGRFDDYDGYSYQGNHYDGTVYTINPSVKENQKLDQIGGTTGLAILLVDYLQKYNLFHLLPKDYRECYVDEALSYFFNDFYVHSLAHRWYNYHDNICSPSTERYSFPSKYSDKIAELAVRFPISINSPSPGKGIPYSTFMPVDNMARYWYERFKNTNDILTMGPVLHAVQDASVLHHSAGYHGNWHQEYEDEMDDRINTIVNDSIFKESVKRKVTDWSMVDRTPPSTLDSSDWQNKIPAINWKIDILVTWIALNSYHAYSDNGIYNSFSNGYSFNKENAEILTELATAMIILIIKKALSNY